MMRFHVYTDDGAFFVDAEAASTANGFTAFFNPTFGTQTTFPSLWRKILLGEQKVQRRIECERETVALVRTSTIQRIELRPASADTLPKGQDAKQGLAGTESGAVPEGETPR